MRRRAEGMLKNIKPGPNRKQPRKNAKAQYRKGNAGIAKELTWRLHRCPTAQWENAFLPRCRLLPDESENKTAPETW